MSFGQIQSTELSTWSFCSFINQYFLSHFLFSFSMNLSALSYQSNRPDLFFFFFVKTQLLQSCTFSLHTWLICTIFIRNVSFFLPLFHFVVKTTAEAWGAACRLDDPSRYWQLLYLAFTAAALLSPNFAATEMKIFYLLS